MKNILTLLVLLSLYITAMAQPPQGINYQAVAFSTTGQPISNHPLGVKLSILTGSPTGSVVYAETQNTITDTLGLFSTVIGNGTVVSGTFATIDWAHGTKWLKLEIDTTGGTSYIPIGTTQFMSVPYALYAGRSSATSPTIDYPDGMDSITPIFLAEGLNYTVPTGKNLYVSVFMDTMQSLNIYGDGIVKVDNDSMYITDVSSFPIAFSAGVNLSSHDVALAGFLVNKTVTWVHADITGTAYTVPAGKMLYIKNLDGSQTMTDVNHPYNHVAINGVNIALPCHLCKNAPIIVDENQSIIYSSGVGHNGNYMYISGYLKDK